MLLGVVLPDGSLPAPPAPELPLPDMPPDDPEPDVSLPELPLPELLPELPLSYPLLPVPELLLPDEPVPEVPLPGMLEPLLSGVVPLPDEPVPEVSLPELLLPDEPVPEVLLPGMLELSGVPVVPLPDEPVPEVSLPELLPDGLVPELPLPDVPLPLMPLLAAPCSDFSFAFLALCFFLVSCDLLFMPESSAAGMLEDALLSALLPEDLSCCIRNSSARCSTASALAGSDVLDMPLSELWELCAKVMLATPIIASKVANLSFFIVISVEIGQKDIHGKRPECN